MPSSKRSLENHSLPNTQVALRKATQLIAEKKYFAAVVHFQDLAKADPNNPDILYPLAVCQRSLNQSEAALNTLGRLQRERPNFAGMWLEKGRAHLSLQQIDLAKEAFRRCVQRNAAYIGGWQGLAAVAAEIGDSELAESSEERIQYLTSLDQALILILRTYHDGQKLKAEQLCREYLRKQKKNVEAMRILARISADVGMLDDAEFILESACAFEPEHRLARLEYIDILHKRQQYGKALHHAEHLLTVDPHDSLHKLAEANQRVALGDFKRALATYDQILDDEDSSNLATPQLYLSRGHAYKTLGNIESSIADYRTAYGKRRDFGDAYWSLANLKTYKFIPSEVDQMLTLVESNAVSAVDRVHMAFALGASFENQSLFRNSFKYYELGNSLNQKRLQYDISRMTASMQRQREICDSDMLATAAMHGNPSPDPIFILGLPRSGSTLLEQILASHSQVEGTRELHHIGSFSQKLNGRQRSNEQPNYPAVLRELSPSLIRQMGDLFLDDTRIHRVENTPHFIDKMPNNFRHVGLISMILPKAKIIDARRHPMSCCFSNYKQLFASGQEFTYGQREIGTYYRDYCELMDHWHSVLPGKILTVYYENVVDNLEEEVRRILDYCELPFEAACLKFHETERAIRTPSAEQVRQPIYRQGLDQWHNYAKWLNPMRQALGDALRREPYSK